MKAGTMTRIQNRFLLVTLAVLGVATTRPAAAQERETREGGLPRDAARDIASVWNNPSTRRERGAFTLAQSDTVRGDLAILDGPATLSGVVTGRVVVINGDATLNSSAHIGGSLVVVGGTLDRSQGTVVGDISVWRARMRYHEEDNAIVPEPENEITARWQRWRRGSDDEGRHGELFLTTAHTYNRVEGLPILFGPRLRARNGDTRYDLELFGIFRTGERLAWERENLGHRARFELRQGRTRGFAIGARLFDEVHAVERWQLTNAEVGLASFVFSRDYRDYWNRHGGNGFVRLISNRRNYIAASYGEERWESRRARDPFTLFNNSIAWRANPAADQGVLGLFTIEGILDSRNDLEHPRTGWLLSAHYERGDGDLVRSPLVAPAEPPTVSEQVAYGRALFDLRRYNRLGPGAQLNVRAVFGGWLHGDSLPRQRRLSVSGVDALPGLDFRRLIGGTNGFDIGTCVSLPTATYAEIGRPANCHRILLIQAEWKGDFRVSLFGDTDHGDERWFTSRFNADGTWVLFSNSGRGWMVGDDATSGMYSSTRIPPMGTWRTDIGGGFDFGDFGAYVAKSVTHGAEPANVFVRLGRRF